MAKIKIGLLIDDLIIPFWAYKMIENINSTNYAEIVLIVKKRSFESKRSVMTRFKEKYRFIFYSLYQRLEKKIRKQSPDAFESRDLGKLIHSSRIMEVTCDEKKFSDYFKAADISRIKEYNIDLFIRLGFRILRGDILKSARLGIWSYHHGDNFVNRGGPPGFYETFRREREIGSILQILTEDLDGGQVLYRSWSAVHRLHHDTLSDYYWKTSLFIPRKLKELYESGEEAFLDRIRSENNNLSFYSHKLYTTPPNALFFSLFVTHFWDWLLHNIWKEFNFEQWILLYAFGKKSGPVKSIFNYKRLTPPKDRFWADPSVIFENEKYFIFFEEFVYKGKGKGKGHLCAMEINEKGISSPLKIILEKPYHLSYPFVFKYEGEYYMIPESEKNFTIELYKAKNFPYEWEFKMNLMENIIAVDTTIFLKDNKVWLFSNIVEMPGIPFSEELCLFWSDSLFSKDWHPHPCNPIVSDVKSARPAGKIFYYNEKIYRPSQDCSYKYGYATIINEILVLNEKDYKERMVSEISPNWDKDVVATHTFSFDNNLSAIDAAITRRKKF